MILLELYGIIYEEFLNTVLLIFLLVTNPMEYLYLFLMKIMWRALHWLSAKKLIPYFAYCFL